MDNIFKRSNKNPVLKPRAKVSWESSKVYNPGAILVDDKYYLLYRAAGKGVDWHSSIGLAVSKDGVNFTRNANPIINSQFPYEKKGCEDPRISKIGNTFYLTYTAFDGLTARLALATSKNLKTWKKHGPILKNWNFKYSKNFLVQWDMAFDDAEEDKNWSKAGGIFPESINGKYYMLFGDRHVWMATSTDGLKWNPINKPFLVHRNRKSFSAVHLEMGPPPIKTPKGWLVLYHGIDARATYRLGYLLLDLKNPKKILFRSKKPIFEPKTNYECNKKIDLTGDNTPQVVFCNGAVLQDNKLRIFYGAGDSSVCTAVCDVNKLF